ncbi:MAG: hypothetical protein WC340_15325 [Kiritimatiellia bacterium]
MNGNGIRRSKAYYKWRTALHEAAHLQTALLLTHDLLRPAVSATLVVEGATSGIASCAGQLTPFNEAVMTAAGTYGGKLVNEWPRPRSHYRKKQLIERQLKQSANGELTAESVRKVFQNYKGGPSDAESVAKFCTSFEPDNPGDWMKRYKRVHAKARLLVWTHRQTIRTIATELYLTGIYHREAETNRL